MPSMLSPGSPNYNYYNECRYQDEMKYELDRLEYRYHEYREEIYRKFDPRYRMDYYNYPSTYQYQYSYLNSLTGAMSMPLISPPTETKKFIIISSAGAAEHPAEHKTLADAEAEATRLAKQFPKQEFTVYETKKSFKVADKPVDVKVYA